MLTLFKTGKSRKHATKLQQVTTYTASQKTATFSSELGTALFKSWLDKSVI